ncbi:MAG TPA: DUF86 domain-containing protein [Candidatus Methanoperedenaceae archaeon]|nr:DUF86 domain-containing protein [Candidatus Methanoperedenaceae archaeon]
MDHILEEIEFLEKVCMDLEFEDLKQDEVLKRAITRSLEIIGEAAKNISDDLKDKHPEIEWRKIAGLRDKLVHAYFGIDWDIVWDVLKNRLSGMRESLRNLKDKEAGS